MYVYIVVMCNYIYTRMYACVTYFTAISQWPDWAYLAS